MSIEEQVLKYGVVGGMRYKESEKIHFLNTISPEFRELGYNVQILKKDLKRFSGVNCYIGDVVNAKNIIIANYDTPVNSFNPNMKYFPFDDKATQRELNEKSRYKAISIILVGAVIMFALPMFIKMEPMIARIINIAITVIMTGVAYMFLKSAPNQFNANMNTSGVLGVLEIAKAKPKNTAFILTDREFVDNLGDVMVQEALPQSLDQKNIIKLKAIGRGEHIIVSFKDSSEALAKEFIKKNKSAISFKLDENGLRNNSMQYYENIITLTVADEFNGYYEIRDVCSQNDLEIDGKIFEKVVNMVIKHLI